MAKRGRVRAKKRKRRSYSEKERAAVLDDVAELGLCEAARRHGIPDSTVALQRSPEWTHLCSAKLTHCPI